MSRRIEAGGGAGIAVAVAVAVTVVVVGCVCVVVGFVVYARRAARPAPPVVHPEPAESSWLGYNNPARASHSLAYNDTSPLSDLESADAYRCVCTQEVCGGARAGGAGEEDTFVRDLSLYGPGWVCTDMVFNTRKRAAPAGTAEEKDEPAERAAVAAAGARGQVCPQLGGRFGERTASQSAVWRDDED